MPRPLALAVVLAGCTADTALPCTPRGPADTDADVEGFYACVDAHLAGGAGCGPDGYPLGFGGRYGQRYWDGAAAHLSPEGRAWIQRVASCLQVALIAAIDTTTTCADVWTDGFGTHDDCYVDTGFCDLPLTDQLWVFAQIDPVDRERPEVVAMGQSVLARCAAPASDSPAP